MVQPRYYGTRKGRVIHLIAVDGFHKRDKIRDILGWDYDQLERVLSALKNEKILEETDREFKVEFNTLLEYRAYFGDEWAKKKIDQIEERTYWKNRSIRINIILKKGRGEKYLLNRFRRWIRFKPQLKYDLNTSHIYLTNNLFGDVLIDQIDHARKQILVVNPIVERCPICESLKKASGRGVDIILVTRSPDQDQNNHRTRIKTRYQKTIKDSKIDLYYNESVHAKICILDNQVLSSSSLNLSSESTVGTDWESGIVSIDSSNIIQATESFVKLLNEPDTEIQKNTFDYIE